MTPGLRTSSDIRTSNVMYDHIFQNLQILDQTLGHTKWAVSMVIAYGHFNLILLKKLTKLSLATQVKYSEECTFGSLKVSSLNTAGI